MATLESIEQKLIDLATNNEKEHAAITKHLDRLNGQVARNTAFKNKAMGAGMLLGFMGIGSLVGVITLWIKFFNM